MRVTDKSEEIGALFDWGPSLPTVYLSEKQKLEKPGPLRKDSDGIQKARRIPKAPVKVV